MCALRVWRVLCTLCYVGASVFVNGVALEQNCTDDYDNEIPQDYLTEESPVTPCQAVDLSRWDKLFINLEDAHMRQNILLESVERCCGGAASFRAQVEKLAKEACRQRLPSLDSACHTQLEQVSLRLQRGLAELRVEGAERERRMNSTLHQLLHAAREQSAELKRPEESGAHGAEAMGGGRSAGAGQSGAGPITPRPGGSGAGLGLGVKPFTPGLKEQKVASSLDLAKLERSLVAIATQLQKMQLQLSRLVERVG
ncbi:uncharacterized protein LOC130126766 [Lampris incognitus]|uniref:uncharacterized protein LOC130126766 n=1 Tax=Lampris incognitus TaxID=2546036 RepID=UPI0024B580CD|nr:uncharacterized protein LOC130126766 [Lampris incognitus]